MKEAILEVKNLRKRFGANEIHKGINFSLYAGESLGLLGGSGTGKSVLLRSIIGLEYIDEGQILFKNTKLNTLTERQLAPYRVKISYSFQDGALFDSLNVFENIAYPLFEHTNLKYGEIQDKVSNILQLIDLKGTEELMPSDLSGGMKKRIGLARAVVMNPDIILYDEPTAGLDPTNTINIVKVMKKLQGDNQSSIFVTHDIPSAISFCDRIMIIDGGVIGFVGTCEEFLESPSPIVKKFKMDQGMHYGNQA